MDFNNLFKGFFGFGNHNFGTRMHDDDSDDASDEPGDFGDAFSQFHREMKRQMEEFNNEFEQLFMNFGHPLIPPAINLPEKEPSPNNPRDHMLKDSESNEDVSKSKWGHRSRPALPFGNFFSWTQDAIPQKKEDRDLDGDVDKYGISSIFENADVRANDFLDNGQQQPHGFPRSFGRSWSSVTVRGADGKTETRQTVRDSSGNEETTVTRTIGDQSYIVTTKDKDGQCETVETFQNMDEKDIANFNAQWDNKDIAKKQIKREDLLIPHQGSSASNRGLFSTLLDIFTSRNQ
ncbi:hypothetical protein CHS0354_013359 [Potamilus streckersoni]|uniref:HCLS1-associated protein X-1 n=1 Tax=Potamilus streckersoni TaxID=2493646 RepID=A0AAE0T258_9BIVA|nr:hypothetical protein CHS0354_013359 [Potamilus streckersoni]